MSDPAFETVCGAVYFRRISCLMGNSFMPPLMMKNMKANRKVKDIKNTERRVSRIET